MASHRTRVRPIIAACFLSQAIFLNGCWIALPPPARPEPAGVRSFLHKLQEIDLAEIGRTCYDLIVIDYSSDGGEGGEFTRGEIEAARRLPSPI